MLNSRGMFSKVDTLRAMDLSEPEETVDRANAEQQMLSMAETLGSLPPEAMQAVQQIIQQAGAKA
jgi:hypothetical protein